MISLQKLIWLQTLKVIWFIIMLLLFPLWFVLVLLLSMTICNKVYRFTTCVKQFCKHVFYTPWYVGHFLTVTQFMHTKLGG